MLGEIVREPDRLVSRLDRPPVSFNCRFCRLGSLRACATHALGANKLFPVFLVQ